MVTAISLAHRRGDGLSPCCPSDSISHSTGRFCVRNALTLMERGSFNWSWVVPSTLFHFNIWIVLIFLLSTPFLGKRVILDSYPSVSLLRIGTLDLITIPLPNYVVGWNVDMFEASCLVTQQTRISQESFVQF